MLAHSAIENAFGYHDTIEAHEARASQQPE